jgi:hypothetical protein
MKARTVLTIVNFSIVIAVIAVLLMLPQFTPFAFYFLIGWLVAGLVLFYAPWSTRAVGAAGAAPASTGGAPASAGFPLSAAPTAPAAPARLDFCVYCAAPLAATETHCVACGHDRGPF